MFKLLKNMMIFLGGVVLTLFITSLTVLLLFLYEETKRGQLLEAYEVPDAFINDLVVKGAGQVEDLFVKDEMLLCIMDSYGVVDELSSLNRFQRDSIEKNELPSEGLTWYLLFFSNNKASRIYLVDKTTMIIDGRSFFDGCLKGNSKFEVNIIPGKEPYYKLYIKSVG